MYQFQKKRKSCCPYGHILVQEKTLVKLESFLQTFPANVKIHVPSSLTCSRCSSKIYAENQPTVATCAQCNFHLCQSCVADATPLVSMECEEEEDYTSRRRKGRECDANDTEMFCDYTDPNVVNLASRYNNRMPNYSLFPRVSNYHYPEPRNFGWKFTGSCESGKTEYYERDSDKGTVLLDFDCATGTVKTVLNHRIDGQIPLFAKGKSLLPDIYQKVLQNPEFSDTRYRRRLHC